MPTCASSCTTRLRHWPCRLLAELVFVVLAEARAMRQRLHKKRKKESQRARKAHAGAMGALRALGAAVDAEGLRAGVATAAA